MKRVLFIVGLLLCFYPLLIKSEPHIMPDVTGLGLNEAITEIEDVFGYDSSFQIIRTNTTDVKRNTVIKTSPKADVVYDYNTFSLVVAGKE